MSRYPALVEDDDLTDLQLFLLACGRVDKSFFSFSKIACMSICWWILGSRRSGRSKRVQEKKDLIEVGCASGSVL